MWAVLAIGLTHASNVKSVVRSRGLLFPSVMCTPDAYVAPADVVPSKESEAWVAFAASAYTVNLTTTTPLPPAPPGELPPVS